MNATVMEGATKEPTWVHRKKFSPTATYIARGPMRLKVGMLIFACQFALNSATAQECRRMLAAREAE